ncbi:hypothetical protein BZA70DRAFT_137350 [Myxozyma melibiosi]|uniref:Uncharacterized protein n=1 Tax=Myxozyma melibiosi TaxID=54550 RepID=A0ABR1F752_9ASCO
MTSSLGYRDVESWSRQVVAPAPSLSLRRVGTATSTASSSCRSRPQSSSSAATSPVLSISNDRQSSFHIAAAQSPISSPRPSLDVQLSGSCPRSRSLPTPTSQLPCVFADSKHSPQLDPFSPSPSASASAAATAAGALAVAAISAIASSSISNNDNNALIADHPLTYPHRSLSYSQPPRDSIDETSEEGLESLDDEEEDDEDLSVAEGSSGNPARHRHHHHRHHHHHHHHPHHRHHHHQSRSRRRQYPLEDVDSPTDRPQLSLQTNLDDEDDDYDDLSSDRPISPLSIPAHRSLSYTQRDTYAPAELGLAPLDQTEELNDDDGVSEHSGAVSRVLSNTSNTGSVVHAVARSPTAPAEQVHHHHHLNLLHLHSLQLHSSGNSAENEPSPTAETVPEKNIQKTASARDNQGKRRSRIESAGCCVIC